MPVSKICEFCGKPFAVRPAKGTQRFCSLACRKANRESAHADLICEQCGETFHVTRKRELSQRFCSKACTTAYERIHGRVAARGERKETTWFDCRQCGKPFPMKPGYLTEYRRKYGKDPMYCSNACSGLGRQADTDAKHETTCKNCGKSFRKSRRSSGGVYREQMLCSRQCKNEWVSKVYREKHGLPTITKRIKRGYVVLRIPASDGRPVQTDILEHRYVMEQLLGRPLLPGETVHHRSGDKTDNSPENLQLFVSNHGPGQAAEDVIDWCIEMMQRYERFLRRRGYRLTHFSRRSTSVSEPPLLLPL